MKKYKTTRSRGTWLLFAAGVVLFSTAAAITHLRQGTLIGHWQAQDINPSGAQESVTADFTPDGRVTLKTQALQDTLVAGGLPQSMVPDVRRAIVTGTYAAKGDALTILASQMHLYGSQGQPVTLPGSLSYTHTVYRYGLHNGTLTLDQRNGTPPTVLTRRHL